MEFTTFVRKPFMVLAVQVTKENIEEVAKLVGTLRHDGAEDNKDYIQVDRRLVPNVYKVYPGFWLTKMGDNVRCYSGHIFDAQFVEGTQEMEDWVKTLNEQNV